MSYGLCVLAGVLVTTASIWLCMVMHNAFIKSFNVQDYLKEVEVKVGDNSTMLDCRINENVEAEEFRDKDLVINLTISIMIGFFGCFFSFFYASVADSEFCGLVAVQCCIGFIIDTPARIVISKVLQKTKHCERYELMFVPLLIEISCKSISKLKLTETFLEERSDSFPQNEFAIPLDYSSNFSPKKMRRVEVLPGIVNVVRSNVESEPENEHIGSEKQGSERSYDTLASHNAVSEDENIQRPLMFMNTPRAKSPIKSMYPSPAKYISPVKNIKQHGEIFFKLHQISMDQENDEINEENKLYQSPLKNSFESSNRKKKFYEDYEQVSNIENYKNIENCEKKNFDKEENGFGSEKVGFYRENIENDKENIEKEEFGLSRIGKENNGELTPVKQTFNDTFERNFEEKQGYFESDTSGLFKTEDASTHIIENTIEASPSKKPINKSISSKKLKENPSISLLKSVKKSASKKSTKITKQSPSKPRSQNFNTLDEIENNQNSDSLTSNIINLKFKLENPEEKQESTNPSYNFQIFKINGSKPSSASFNEPEQVRILEIPQKSINIHRKLISFEEDCEDQSKNFIFPTINPLENFENTKNPETTEKSERVLTEKDEVLESERSDNLMNINTINLKAKFNKDFSDNPNDYQDSDFSDYDSEDEDQILDIDFCNPKKGFSEKIQKTKFITQDYNNEPEKTKLKFDEFETDGKDSQRSKSQNHRKSAKPPLRSSQSREKEREVVTS